MGVKNQTEIECLTRAYLRDGVSFVKFLAWLESKLAQGHEDITEPEASQKLLEYRKNNRYFIGLACDNFSANRLNTASHDSTRKDKKILISRDHLYLK